MAAINRSLKKRRKGTKRLDLTDLREVLKDRRQWCSLGIVTDIDDNGAVQFEFNDDGSIRDILVDVVTVPGDQELVCRMSGISSTGVLSLPNEGDEVVVVIPEGRNDFHPTIMAVLSSQSIPNDSEQGPAQNRIILVSGEVFVHDGDGGAEPLPTLQEFKTHFHVTPMGPSDPPSLPPPAEITGTLVLKAK